MNNTRLERNANSAVSDIERIVSELISEIETHEETIDKLTDEVDSLNNEINDLKAEINELKN